MTGTAPTSTDCEAYYKMENTTDASGNGNTLVVSGATSGVTGIIDDGYSTDGSNDYIQTKTLGDVQSISFWIKTTDTNSELASIRDSSILIKFQQDASGYPIFIVRDSNNKRKQFKVSSAINDGNKHHLVGTWSTTDDTASFYCDDVAGSVDTYSDSFTGNTTTSVKWVLGGNYYGGMNSWIAATFDECSIFNVVLSSDNATYLYNSGSPGSDQQYPFSVADSLTLTDPNGGESLTEDDVFSITWTDTGSIANVQIELTLDNGSSYDDIVASTPNDGSYSWTIPDEDSSSCLVRISDVLDSGVNDVSDAVFTIESIPPVLVPDKNVGGGIQVQSWLSIIPFGKIIRGELEELSNRLLSDWGLLSPIRQIAGDFSARVVKVHDGDTVTLSTSWRKKNFSLRLADIDAPELSEGGHRARDWLRSRILGKRVLVHVDNSNRVGKYGRIIGEIYSSGFNVGDEMRNRGLVAKFGEKNMFLIPKIDKLLAKHEVSRLG